MTGLIDRIRYFLQVGKVLLLIRGVPSMGKTFLAKRILERLQQYSQRHLETDDLFTDTETGIYTYDKSKLMEYHNTTLQMAQNAMSPHGSREDLIIVSNTFNLMKFMDGYKNHAFRNQYSVIVVDLFHSVNGRSPQLFQKPRTPQFQAYLTELVQRNQATHNIPRDALERMIDIYEMSSHAATYQLAPLSRLSAPGPEINLTTLSGVGQLLN